MTDLVRIYAGWAGERVAERVRMREEGTWSQKSVSVTKSKKREEHARRTQGLKGYPWKSQKRTVMKKRSDEAWLLR